MSTEVSSRKPEVLAVAGCVLDIELAGAGLLIDLDEFCALPAHPLWSSSWMALWSPNGISPE